MKLTDLPPGAIDWSQISPTVQAGATGTATTRTRCFGETQLRLVAYGAGYIADHWCDKGHVLFVVDGDLVIEHDDGSRYELQPGMTWHVADEIFPPHRVVCADGATVFIVD
jgi:hypothetical protein